MSNDLNRIGRRSCVPKVDGSPACTNDTFALNLHVIFELLRSTRDLISCRDCELERTNPDRESFSLPNNVGRC